jgi:hypothetical protein
LYHAVFHSGVPCGATAQVSGPEPWTVYGISPFVTPGAGFTSQRNPIDKLKRCDTLHSSSAKAEKFLYNGYAGASTVVSAKSKLFVSTED